MRRLIVVWVAALSLGVVGCDGGSGGDPGGDAVVAADVDAVSSDPDVGALDADGASGDAVSDVGEGSGCLLAKSWTDYPIGPQECRRYEYDASGLRVLVASDMECDGVEEKCWVTEWDSEGRMTGSYRDADCDGTVDSLCLWWVFDDELGQMTETEDNDCDGTPEFLRIHLYDDEGQLVHLTVEEGGEGGFATYCHGYSYDEYGNETEDRQDDGCDGVWDHCQVATFDADGFPTSKHQDDDCDGIPDRNCRTFEIETGDDGTVEMMQQLDSDCDGTDVTCWSSTTTEAGLEIASEKDDDCDGAGETCKALEFDADGNLLHGTIEEPCGATPSVCARAFTLDASGLVITSQADASCDGKPEDCETFVYDDQGRIIESTMDSDCDGMSSPRCEFFEFDAFGNLVEHRTEKHCEDDFVILEHWEYDCGT